MADVEIVVPEEDRDENRRPGRPSVDIDYVKLEEALAVTDSAEAACETIGLSKDTLFYKLRTDKTLQWHYERGGLRRKARESRSDQQRRHKPSEIITAGIQLGINTRAQMKGLLGYSYDMISIVLDQELVNTFAVVEIAGVENYFINQAAADAARTKFKEGVPPPTFKRNVAMQALEPLRRPQPRRASSVVQMKTSTSVSAGKPSHDPAVAEGLLGKLRQQRAELDLMISLLEKSLDREQTA